MDQYTDNKIARITGIIGLLSLAFFMLAIGIAQYVPVPVKELSLVRIAETKDDWALIAAIAISIYASPGMLLLGYHYYLGLRPAGNIFSLTATFLFTFAMLMALATHVAQVYSILAIKYGAEAEKIPLVYENLLATLSGNLQWSLIISALIAWIAIWWKKTNYPYWVSRTNPLFLIFLFAFISRAMPPEVAGFYHPTRFYMGMFIFFAISVGVLWNNTKIDDRAYQKEANAAK